MGVPQDPELSLIVPCYNEQDAIPHTIPALVKAFEDAGHRLELIGCDNGSRDRTGEILRDFAARGLPVVYHRVEPNEGYGNGVIRSFAACRAPWIGIIPADGQVDAEDVARLFSAVKHTSPKNLAKVRRRFRMDGPVRKVVSVLYNGFVWILWPRLGSIDVNGSPKIIPREVWEAMRPESKQWFLDPEIMVKAHYMGVRVLEMNVFARMRGNGLSHVRGSTALEFFTKLLKLRFGSGLRRWREGLIWPPPARDAAQSAVDRTPRPAGQTAAK